MTLLVAGSARSTAGSGMALPGTAAALAVEEGGVGVPGVDAGTLLLYSVAETDEAFLEQVSGAAPVQTLALRVRYERGRHASPSLWGVGERVDHLIVGPVSIEKAIDQAEATASFDLVVDGEILDGPLELEAPVGGLGGWDLVLAFRADGAVREFPVMTSAISSSGSRSWAGFGRGIDRLQLVDLLGRYRDTPINFSIRAGSGLLLNRVVHLLASRAGMPYRMFSPGAMRLLRPVSLVKGDWLSLALELADAQGQHLVVDRDGYLTDRTDRPENPPYNYVGETAVWQRARWQWGPDDVVVAVNGSPLEVLLEPPADVWTEVCAQGVQHRTRSSASAETSSYPFIAFGTFAPRPAPFRQDTGGGVTFESSWIQPAAEQERRSGETILTREGDAVLAERSIEFTFRNLLAARRTLNPDGTVAGHRACYLEEDVSGALGHLWGAERLIRTAEVTVAREWDEDGFLKRLVRERRGYRLAERHIRQRASQSASWEAATGPAGLLELGDGRGLASAVEEWALLERETEEWSREEGFLAYHRVEVEGWHLPAGWEYLYHGGRESSSPVDVFDLASVTEEFWVAIGDEEEHVYRRQRFGADGRLLSTEDEPAIEERRAGARPPAERREDLAPDRDEFPTEAEFQEAFFASQHEALDISYTHKQPHPHRPRRETQISSQWINDPRQLVDTAQRVAIRSRFPLATWTIAPNPLVRRGDFGHLRIPALKLDHDVFVRRIHYQVDPSGLVLMALTAEVR